MYMYYRLKSYQSYHNVHVQLEQSYEKTVNGLAACQDSLETLKEKDTKSTGLVTELTTVSTCTVQCTGNVLYTCIHVYTCM